jgi:hypothetical protein
MVDAAHEAVWFDAFWAINSRADFKKAVWAMIRAAMERYASLALRREMNKPAFYFRAVLLQPFQKFCRRFIWALVNWMNSVPSLKVGYVVS